MLREIKGINNVTIKENGVVSLILKGGVCKGVVLEDGERVEADAVVLTTGTFLKGVLRVGKEVIKGGRMLRKEEGVENIEESSQLSN